MNKQELEKAMKKFGIDTFHVYVNITGLPMQIARLDSMKIKHSVSEDDKPLNILDISVTALNKQELIDMFGNKYHEEMKPYMPKERKVKHEQTDQQVSL